MLRDIGDIRFSQADLFLFSVTAVPVHSPYHEELGLPGNRAASRALRLRLLVIQGNLVCLFDILYKCVRVVEH